MSVGGRIVDLVPVSPAKLWVNTQEPSSGDECAVYCDPQGHDIRVGDSFWWQGGACYWTPKGREAFGAADIPLPKLGFSGVTKPEVSDAR